MRRSQIETIIRESQEIMARYGQILPPYAGWSPAQWHAKAEETRAMRSRFLGWNVVEFAEGDFARSGIVVFTTRMGDHGDLARGRGKLYGEKIIVCRDGQRVPHHYHRVKTEDFVNRGGGTLVIDLIRVDEAGLALDQPFDLDRDGEVVRVPGRSTLRLAPGEGITLDPFIAHAFSAENGDIVCGELSLANDDATDNYFLAPVPAQPIIEDVPVRHLVVADYKSF
jgi:D-lyxose ketol-isomerase